MTNTERVIEYLTLIAPKAASNADIRSATGVKPHQQIFQITDRLMREHKIRGRQFGKEWQFWIDASRASTRQNPIAPPDDA